MQYIIHYIGNVSIFCTYTNMVITFLQKQNHVTYHCCYRELQVKCVLTKIILEIPNTQLRINSSEFKQMRQDVSVVSFTVKMIAVRYISAILKINREKGKLANTLGLGVVHRMHLPSSLCYLVLQQNRVSDETQHMYNVLLHCSKILSAE